MMNKEDVLVRKEAIARIKPVLQSTMLKKLNPLTPWSYVASIPYGLSCEQVIRGINYFAFNKIDELITLCGEVLPYFSYEDMISIGTSTPTENAQKFVDIFAYLVINGFPGPYDFGAKSLNFWSGKIGKEKAYASAEAISDGNIPAIAAMYDICRAIRLLQGKHDDFINLLISSISRLYAAHSIGVVHVYISSDKTSEMPGLLANNNFWNSELPTLRNLLQRNLINDIQIHTYDHYKNKWNKPFSIDSTEALDLPIRHRSIHPLDNPSHADRFQTFFMNETKNWQASEARPEISYGGLLKICGIWRGYRQVHDLSSQKAPAPEFETQRNSRTA